MTSNLHIPYFLLALFFFGFIRESSAQELTSRQLEMMKDFANVYSELRYFYPDDALSAHDWDLLLIRGTEMIQRIQPDDFNDSVTAFFQPFTPGITVSPKGSIGLKNFQRVKRSDVFHQYKGYAEGPGFYSHMLVNSTPVPENDPPGIVHWIDQRPVLENARIEITCKARSQSGKTSLRLGTSIYDYAVRRDSINTKSIALSDDWSVIKWEDRYNQGSSFVSLFAGITGNGTIQIKDLTMKIFLNDSLYLEEPLVLSKTNPGALPRTTINRPFGYAYTIDQAANFLQISRINEQNPTWLYASYPNGRRWKRIHFSEQSYLVYPIAKTVKNYQKTHDDSLAFQLQLQTIDDKQVVANRFATVIKIYSVIHLFFPYKDFMQFSSESYLMTYLGQINKCSTEVECLNAILRMTADLNDGHCYVDHPLKYPERCAEADFEWYNEHLYVTGASENCLLQKGDIVLNVDGISAASYLEQRMLLRSGSPQWKNCRETLVFSCGDSSQAVNYQIVRDRVKMNLSIQRTGYAGSTISPTYDPFSIVADSIAYMDLSRYDYSSFQLIADTLSSLKGLIVDLRNYPRMFPEFLGHFTDSVLFSANWETPAVIARGETVFDNAPTWEINPAFPRAECKTVFLIGSGTISYGESLTDIIDHYGLGTTIGSTTAGANGNKTSFKAPGGYLIYFTGMQVKRRDGSPLFAKGIDPMVYYSPQWTQNGDDTVEFAIRYIKDHPSK